MASRKPTKPSGAPNKGATSKPSKAVVPARAPGGLAPIRFKKENGQLVPEGYTMRPIIPAEHYDVVSVAKAMNRENFAPRLKEIFEPENEAAEEAIRTGIYIGYRCPDFQHDCIRVGKTSKCFCGHVLSEHDKFDGVRIVRQKCKQSGCRCPSFAWIPSRPEEVGEFWYQRRTDFDPSTWRAMCRCKHSHETHDVVTRNCKTRGCGCTFFNSSFLCAACDRHWEQHETFFETEAERKRAGLPYGEAYIPFNEMPNLRNAALTGREDDESRYLALTQGEDMPPSSSRHRAITDSSSSASGQAGFRPVYD